MASLTPTHDLPSIVEGDDVSVPISFAKPDGAPVDITDWAVSFTVAERDGSEQILIEKDITTHDAPTQGKTGFHLDPADSSGLSGSKRFDIQVTRANGVIQTIVIGSVGFVDGVTDRDTGSGGTDTTGSFSTGGIAVTMADGEISVDVTVSGGFTNADALDAINSSSISPESVGTASDPVSSIYATESNVDELLVTGQTLVRAKPSSVQQFSAGSFQKFEFGDVGTDALDEFDPQTSVFTPQETGIYRVMAQAGMAVGSTGDRLTFALEDDTGSLVRYSDNTSGSQSDTAVPLSTVIKLSSNRTYHFTFRSLGSSDKCRTSSSWASFERVVHQ